MRYRVCGPNHRRPTAAQLTDGRPLSNFCESRIFVNYSATVLRETGSKPRRGESKEIDKNLLRGHKFVVFENKERERFLSCIIRRFLFLVVLFIFILIFI